MKILHTAAKFTSNISDLKIIYNQYIRSVLEYGSNVWHSGLTEQNKNDNERLQKSSLKIILRNNYESYEKALKLIWNLCVKEEKSWISILLKNVWKLKIWKHYFHWTQRIMAWKQGESWSIK